MSFFLIKLLQIVDHIKLSPDAQPPNSRVPKKWAVDGPGRAKVEQFFPKAHVTMYAFVSIPVLSARKALTIFTSGGPVG